MARAHARTLLLVFVRVAELIPRSLPRDRLEELLSATRVSRHPPSLPPAERGSEGQIERRDFSTKPRLPRVAKERSATTQNKLPSRRVIHGLTPGAISPPTPLSQELSLSHSRISTVLYLVGCSCKTRSSRLKYNTELLLLGSRARLKQVASVPGFRLN